MVHPSPAHPETNLSQTAKGTHFVWLVYGTLGLLIGVGGVGTSAFLIWKSLSGNSRPKVVEAIPETHQEAPPSPDNHPVAYEMKNQTFGFTPRRGGRVRYAQVTLSLECRTRESWDYVSRHRAQARDALFAAVSDTPYEIVSEPDGIIQFKMKILEKLKEAFGDQAPVRVLISDWILAP